MWLETLGLFEILDALAAPDIILDELIKGALGIAFDVELTVEVGLDESTAFGELVVLDVLVALDVVVVWLEVVAILIWAYEITKLSIFIIMFQYSHNTSTWIGIPAWRIAECCI